MLTRFHARLRTLGLLTIAWGSLLAAPTRAQLPPEPDADGVRIETPASDPEADVLLQQGLQLQRQGRIQEAIAVLETARQQYEERFDPDGMAQTYTALGSAYARLEQLRSAQQMFESQVFVARQRGDTRGLIAGLNNAGTVMLRRGRVEMAQRAFAEAYELAMENDLTRLLGLTTSNLGLVRATLGNDEEALQLYEAALLLRIEASDEAGQANTFNNMGDVYWALDDYDNAIANYGAALRLVQSGGEIVEGGFDNYLRSVDGLAEAHRSVGRYLRSRELLEDRLEQVRSRGNVRQEMNTLRSLAELYAAAEQPEEAVRLYRGALAIAQRLEDIRAESRIATALSQLLVRLRDSSLRR